MYEHGSELVKFHIKSCTWLEQTGRSSCHENTITKHKIASELVKFRICSETRLARLHIWTQKAIAARKFQSKTLTKLILLVICTEQDRLKTQFLNWTCLFLYLLWASDETTTRLVTCHPNTPGPNFTHISLGWSNHSKTIQVEFRAQWYNIMMELRNQRIFHCW
jgi:hypothetical protein